MSRAVLVPPDFDPAPSAGRAVLLEIAGPADADGAPGPAGTGALGVLVAETGEPPARLGIDRATLARSGQNYRSAAVAHLVAFLCLAVLAYRYLFALPLWLALVIAACIAAALVQPGAGRAGTRAAA